MENDERIKRLRKVLADVFGAEVEDIVATFAFRTRAGCAVRPSRAARRPIVPAHAALRFGGRQVNAGLLVDNFAGGGGASLGIVLATGREIDIAINHDRAAVEMHAANHPGCKHFCEDVWTVDPVAACGGREVDLAWFSPDCFSPWFMCTVTARMIMMAWDGSLLNAEPSPMGQSRAWKCFGYRRELWKRWKGFGND